MQFNQSIIFIYLNIRNRTQMILKRDITFQVTDKCVVT